MTKSITCVICYDDIYFPYKTTCNHSFCRTCLSQWICISNRHSCPICRTTISNLQDEPSLAKPNLDRFLLLDYTLGLKWLNELPTISYEYGIWYTLIWLILSTENTRSFLQLGHDSFILFGSLLLSLNILRYVFQFSTRLDFILMTCCLVFSIQLLWYRVLFPLSLAGLAFVQWISCMELTI